MCGTWKTGSHAPGTYRIYLQFFRIAYMLWAKNVVVILISTRRFDGIIFFSVRIAHWDNHRRCSVVYFKFFNIIDDFIFFFLEPLYVFFLYIHGQLLLLLYRRNVFLFGKPPKQQYIAYRGSLPRQLRKMSSNGYLQNENIKKNIHIYMK